MEIFVGNLPFSLTQDQLADCFGKIGPIQKIRMMYDSQRRFRGMAYIDFEDPSNARAAVEQLNGADLGGRPMRVDFSRPIRPRFTGFGAGFGSQKKKFPKESGDSKPQGLNCRFHRGGSAMEENNDRPGRPFCQRFKNSAFKSKSENGDFFARKAQKHPYVRDRFRGDFDSQD